MTTDPSFQMPILNIEEVYKIYQSEKTETAALRGVSLTVYPGDISRLSGEQIVRERRRFAGLVFQETKLISHLNVSQNVKLGGHLAGMEKEEIDERTSMLIDLVGLGDRVKHKPNMLSGGERQRVALAAALVTNPQLIIADEVTASLDPLTGEQILDVLDDINRELGVALLIATHAQQVASRAERIIEIKDGVILATHGSSIRLRDLAETRRLAVDNQNRISLPEDIMKLLGNPRSFRARLQGQQILLSIPEDELYEVEKVLTCSVCGELVDKGSQVCKNCGMVIT